MITESFLVPVKYEQVVFCGLSEFQLALYRLFISSPEIKALLRGKESQPLKAINILKKLCNHPELLDLPKDLHGSEKLIPEGFHGANSSGRDKYKDQSVRCDWGGKFLVLERYHSFIYRPENDIYTWFKLDFSIACGLRPRTKSFSSATTPKP